MREDRSLDVAARLSETAARCPDRVALQWQDRALTYAQLDTRATAGAGALRTLGVEPGDRVAIMVGNTPPFVEAHFAALRAGAAVVPLDTRLAADEVAHVLADSGARVCVVAASVAETVLGVRDRLPDLARVVVTGAGEPPAGTDARWRDLLAAEHGFEPVERHPDDLAALVYTSGTTGRPKGAMLTRRNLAANQDQSLAGRLTVEQDDVVLLVLPLSHIYALNVGLGVSVRVGATMVLTERFDPASALDDIERHGVTIILGAPTMYVAWNNLADIERRDLSSVRLAVSGAAPLPAAVLDRFERQFGVQIWEGYGLTEAGPSVTSNLLSGRPRPGSVGLPLPDLEVRLVDDAGDEVVEPGDPGEIHVRGPNVFAGYWNDPAATSEALTDDGWLRTGDVATRDADGYLYLVDRKKDLVNVSGFNVYPREVELVLQSHPGIAECAVVGVPHPYSGEAVKAYVVPSDDAADELSEDDVVRHARRQLARYKIPETVEIVDRLPHTATGKLRRRDLRDVGT